MPTLIDTGNTNGDGYNVLEFRAEPPAPGTIKTEAFVDVRAVLELSTTGLAGVEVKSASNSISKKYGP